MTKTAEAIAKMTAPLPTTDEKQLREDVIGELEQWFDTIGADLPSAADSVIAVVARHLGKAQPSYPQNRTMGSVRKVPLKMSYWNGTVFYEGKQVHAMVAAHSRADAARVLLECGIYNCSQRYIKEFFSACWPAEAFTEIFPYKDTARGVWLRRDRHRYQRLEVKS